MFLDHQSLPSHFPLYYKIECIIYICNALSLDICMLISSLIQRIKCCVILMHSALICVYNYIYLTNLKKVLQVMCIIYNNLELQLTLIFSSIIVGFFPALESTNGIPTPPFFPSFEIAISCAFHWASSHSVGHLYSTGSCISISAANELACLCHAPFALGLQPHFGHL